MARLASGRFGSAVGPFDKSLLYNGQTVYLHLSFVFGLLAYREDVDMVTIRVMIMFFLNEEMRDLEPPEWPSFEYFKANEAPKKSAIMNEISVRCTEFVPEPRFTTGQNIYAQGSRPRKKNLTPN